MPAYHHLLRHLVLGLAAAVAVAVMLMSAGCGRTPVSPVGGELVRSESLPRDTDRILMRQAASGAAADRTLYGHHFQAGGLNSLGENKLRLMLEDAGFVAEPQVHIASGERGHIDAVRRYLSDAGLVQSPQIISGTNPETLRPLAIGLQQQGALDTDQQRSTNQGAASQR